MQPPAAGVDFYAALSLPVAKPLLWERGQVGSLSDFLNFGASIQDRLLDLASLQSEDSARLSNPRRRPTDVSDIEEGEWTYDSD